MLTEYLEKSRPLRNYFNNGLATHLPMLLICIDHLGGNEADFQGAYDFYERTLEPFPKSELTIEGHNWKEYLGQSEIEGSYLMFFQGELQAKGMEATLREYLPFFIKGVVGGAFHPMIQLFYAYRYAGEHEVAAALAGWAIFYAPLFESQKSGGRSFLDTVSQLRNCDELQAFNPGGPLIQIRAEKVAAHSRFQQILSEMDVSIDELDGILEALCYIFVDFQNFSLLHGITSCEAFMGLVDLFEDPDEALYYYCQALLAVYVTTGMPQIKHSKVPERDFQWNRAYAAALESADEHTIKLVGTAKRLNEAKPDKLFEEVAFIISSGECRFQFRYKGA